LFSYRAINSLKRKAICCALLLQLFSQGLEAKNKDSLLIAFRNAKIDTGNYFKLLYKVLKAHDIKLSESDRNAIADAGIRIADSLHLKKAKGTCLLLKAELIMNASTPRIYEGIDVGFKALQVYEELGQKKDIARAQQLLGWFYHIAKNNEEALAFTMKALELASEIKDKKVQSACYNNLGGIYSQLGQNENSLKFYKRCAALEEEFENWPRLARVYGNISEVCTDMRQLDQSIIYRKKAITLFWEMNSRGGVLWHYVGLAEILTYQKKYRLAEMYLDSVDRSAIRSGWTDVILHSFNVRELISAETKNYEKAYLIKLRIQRITDSLNNLNDGDKIAELKLYYEQQKTEKEREVQKKLEQEKHDNELHQQRMLLTGVFLFSVLISIFVFFMYRSLKKVRIQKLEIEKKNREVEEKQKEIIDSIKYAKRIQMAQVPSEKQVGKNLERLRRI